jgi:hypothetical protein
LRVWPTRGWRQAYIGRRRRTDSGSGCR